MIVKSKALEAKIEIQQYYIKKVVKKDPLLYHELNLLVKERDELRTAFKRLDTEQLNPEFDIYMD